MALKVGIVGAGPVGTALGKRLLTKHSVKYSSRDPSSAKVKELLAVQPSATAGTVHGVVDWADVVLLATPGQFEEAKITELALSLGPSIKGKVLIDVTNPLSAYPELALPWSGKSGGEIIQAALPGTFVYKSFNTIGLEHFSAPDGSSITGQQLTMLFAGAPEKKDVAGQVIADVGFAPKYVGPIRYARNLEAIAELWIHLSIPSVGYTQEDWGRNFHFQVISDK